LPFGPGAAFLLFQLVSGRFKAPSVILIWKLPLGKWAEVFGDNTIAAAMVGWLAHYPKFSP
jgi:hypothetical protein